MSVRVRVNMSVINCVCVCVRACVCIIVCMCVTFTHMDLWMMCVRVYAFVHRCVYVCYFHTHGSVLSLGTLSRSPQ